jgi:hypothetical protein
MTKTGNFGASELGIAILWIKLSSVNTTIQEIRPGMGQLTRSRYVALKSRNI